MTQEQVTDRLRALSLILGSLTSQQDRVLREKIKEDIDKLLDLCKI